MQNLNSQLIELYYDDRKELMCLIALYFSINMVLVIIINNYFVDI